MIMKKITLTLIFTVLFLPSFAAPKKDIVDTAVEAGSFNTLVSAVQAAGLVETLKGDGPFTVFAPTDKAFEKFWPETLKNLLQPENRDKLRMLLTYHVLPGKVNAKKAKKLGTAEPLSGGSFELSVKNNNLFINYAKVVKANIKTSNGIVHAIDSVLIPNVVKQTSSIQPSNTDQIIKKAIHKGVPMFNSGHHATTAALYMKAGDEILDQCPSSACSASMSKIKTAMQQASAAGCPTSQAWIMRNAFDEVLASSN
jgi:uncharacterized surface protein with fasciclin (FAS1) repeats